MTLTRRQLLQGAGAAVSVSLVTSAGTAAASQSSTASPSSDSRRVFVHPQNGLLGELLDVVDSVGGTTLREYDNFDFVLAEVPSNRLDELLAATGVASVEEDDETGIPDDWSPSLLESLLPPDRSDCETHPDQRVSWGHERIGATEVEPDGAGVDIGILDTGIQTDHCSLSVAGGRNVTGSGLPDDYEDRHGHGTHVAGVAGALDNDRGVVGTAPNADLYAVKVLDDDGDGRYSDLIAGIDWCMENGVEIISMSLGGESESDAVDEAVETAHSAGHLLLSAAGNEGNNGSSSCTEETMTYPATHDDVVAVTAMNEDDTLASYSSVGEGVDLLAPGTDITSSTVDNHYAEASGTSVATPFVAGVAALVWETREESGPEPGTNEAVRSILGETAEPVLDTCAEGDGLVDARAAVGDDRATGGSDHEEGWSEDGSVGTLRDSVSSAFEWVTELVGAIIDRLGRLFG
ncbi:S8 family peptidase [Natrialba sp. SSL1]|uniref:S8 family peptidase n=1 Tax=Natrialba sp. SSL1 TaxID=1869245 RepID=UPI0008F8858E|nr:S8 family peptidase [Natrialba sp. SSL1]OIB55478.1 peptidase S8 [Natrialba sp. SSL1]